MAAPGDKRKVVADPQARYSGAVLDSRGIVGGYRWKLGLVVLPLPFLALTSLTCWWIVSS